jgi:hypothetical protein
MYTLLLHASGDIVRLVRVSSGENYRREFAAASGDPGDHFWKVYVNSEQWWERLLNDIKFKRFSKMTLKECAKGVWRVPGITAENLHELHMFILTRIMSYNADEPDLSWLDILAEGEYVPVEELCNESGAYALQFTGAARAEGKYMPVDELCNESGAVVPSWAEWRGLIYHIAARLDILGEDITEKHAVGLSRCEFTGNFVLDSNIIPLRHMRSLLQELFQPFSPTHIIKQVQVSKGFGKYATSKQMSSSEVVGLLSDCSMGYAFLDETFSEPCIWEAVAPPPPVASPAALRYIYQSIFDQSKILCLAKPLRDVVDFKLVKEVTCETAFGQELFEKLEVLYNQDLRKDIKNVLETLDVLLPGPPKQGKNDQQYAHTKTYVDVYKDNGIETMAHVVVASVNSFLRSHMSESEININRIGQDLVDLGVRKTRKARGFVYGMQVPSIECDHLPVIG